MREMRETVELVEQPPHRAVGRLALGRMQPGVRHGKAGVLGVLGHLGKQAATPYACLALHQKSGGRAARGLAESLKNSPPLGFSSL